MGAGWLAIRWLHVLAMALFVGGQLVLVVAVVPALREQNRPALRAVARGTWALIAWHIRRPGAYAIEAVVFVVSLAIMWLGLALAHAPARRGGRCICSAIPTRLSRCACTSKSWKCAGQRWNNSKPCWDARSTRP
jgi:hypothetical protein